MSDFSSRLIAWQKQHGRHDLPWQGGDAYRVWLSEIMLQQTQVATVIPYYQRFVASFPTIAALAAATEEQVLANWSGLGYYARGRNLHKAAQIIVEQHGGEFPRQFEQILELPGIGRSTAAAICALAYHERRAILDGNVKRVLARYCGISGFSSEKAVEALLWQQAEALLPDETTSPSAKPASGQVAGYSPPGECWSGGGDVATYTQALMDMGATLCTRSKPKCDKCPVRSDCAALQSGQVGELPTPRPRKAVPERSTTFLLLIHDNDILLEKRAPQGVWGGLWCLPQFADSEEALAWCAQRGFAVDKKVGHSREGVNPVHSKNQYEALPPFTHTFTHFKLHITPLWVELRDKPQMASEPGVMWLDVADALNAAIPTPVRKVLSLVGRNLVGQQPFVGEKGIRTDVRSSP